MKTIRNIIIALSTASMAVSCNLDKFPLDSLSPDTFFSTEGELEAFSNPFYEILPETSLYTEGADMYIQMPLAAEIQGTRTVPASGGGWSFTSLRNINTLLDNLDHCTDQTVRVRYEALARFFRAYFYFNKVKTFGDVPWYDSQVGSEDQEALNRPRDSREFVMQKMIEDIDFAIENLSTTKNVYRVTKWTALALKSRFCLFEGTFRKYHGISGLEHDADWYLRQSADASYELMTTSGYSVYAADGASQSYLTLFTRNIAQSDEVILARNYSLTYGVYHNSNYTTLNASINKGGMNKKIVASYLMKDGSRFTDRTGWQTMSFIDEMRDRDPRLAQSLRTPGYHRIGETAALAPSFASTTTGYQPIKYVTTVDQDPWNSSDIDLIIFRIAEIYLNYAEAKAELGTLTQDDINISIKKLRDRVGMPNLILADANANPDPFLTDLEWGGYRNVTGANKGVILEIRRERAVELCQEGFRYDDIIRWKEGKIFEQQMYGMYFPGLGDFDLDGDGTVDICLYSGAKPASTAPLIYEVGKDIILSNGNSGFVNPYKNSPNVWNEERDYLYPIPSNERSLTGGALTQNPGWNDGLSF